MCNRSIADVWGTLAAQTHRRFIKTPTPLDGRPWRSDVAYLVVGRDPRDVSISYEHHAANMDFEIGQHREQVRAERGVIELGRRSFNQRPYTRTTVGAGLKIGT